jgi:signal transduction histidine kinase
VPLAWVVILAQSDSGWVIDASQRLSAPQIDLLKRWLAAPSKAAWLQKTAGSGKVYQRKTSKAYRALGTRLYAASEAGQRHVLLVGGEASLEGSHKHALLLAARWDSTALDQRFNILAGLNDSDLSQEAIQRIKTWLARDLGVQRLAILKHEPDEAILRSMHAPPLNVPLEGTLEGTVFRIGETVRIDHIARQSRYSGLHPDTQSKIAAPLKFNGRILGVLSVESEQPDRFDLQAEQVIELLGAQVAGLMANQSLWSAQVQLRKAITAVAEFSSERLERRELAVVAQPVVDFITRMYGFDLALFLLLEGENAEFVAAGVAGEGQHGVPHGTRLSAQFGLPGVALAEKRAVEVFNPQVHTEYQAVPDWEAGYAVCVPMFAEGQVIGVLNAEVAAGKAFPAIGLENFAAFANLLPVLFASNVLAARVMDLQKAQRLTEQRLLRSEKLAAVGELAAGVAHELNNPLTTVAGFSELVLETLPDNSPERADLQLVVNEARRAREVVRRLLDFSRQEEFLHAAADIHEVIGAVLALFNHQAQLAGIEIRAKLWDDLPKLRVDKNQMQQVFINLLQNAIQAMPEGGSIDIQTSVQQRDLQEWVMIRLKDSGVGISNENLARVFEPFFTTRRSEQGTGLGLAISYNIVSEHGGFMEVDSEAGRGAAFTIWLPAQSTVGPLLQPQEVEEPHG